MINPTMLAPHKGILYKLPSYYFTFPEASAGESSSTAGRFMPSEAINDAGFQGGLIPSQQGKAFTLKSVVVTDFTIQYAENAVYEDRVSCILELINACFDVYVIKADAKGEPVCLKLGTEKLDKALADLMPLGSPDVSPYLAKIDVKFDDTVVLDHVLMVELVKAIYMTPSEENFSACYLKYVPLLPQNYNLVTVDLTEVLKLDPKEQEAIFASRATYHADSAEQLNTKGLPAHKVVSLTMEKEIYQVGPTFTNIKKIYFIAIKNSLFKKLKDLPASIESVYLNDVALNDLDWVRRFRNIKKLTISNSTMTKDDKPNQHEPLNLPSLEKLSINASSKISRKKFIALLSGATHLKKLSIRNSDIKEYNSINESAEEIIRLESLEILVCKKSNIPDNIHIETPRLEAIECDFDGVGVDEILKSCEKINKVKISGNVPAGFRLTNYKIDSITHITFLDSTFHIKMLPDIVRRCQYLKYFNLVSTEIKGSAKIIARLKSEMGEHKCDHLKILDIDSSVKSGPFDAMFVEMMVECGRNIHHLDVDSHTASKLSQRALTSIENLEYLSILYFGEVNKANLKKLKHLRSYQRDTEEHNYADFSALYEKIPVSQLFTYGECVVDGQYRTTLPLICKSLSLRELYYSISYDPLKGFGLKELVDFISPIIYESSLVVLALKFYDGENLAPDFTIDFNFVKMYQDKIAKNDFKPEHYIKKISVNDTEVFSDDMIHVMNDSLILENIEMENICFKDDVRFLMKGMEKSRSIHRDTILRSLDIAYRECDLDYQHDPEGESDSEASNDSAVNNNPEVSNEPVQSQHQKNPNFIYAVESGMQTGVDLRTNPNGIKYDMKPVVKMLDQDCFPFKEIRRNVYLYGLYSYINDNQQTEIQKHIFAPELTAYFIPTNQDNVGPRYEFTYKDSISHFIPNMGHVMYLWSLTRKDKLLSFSTTANYNNFLWRDKALGLYFIILPEAPTEPIEFNFTVTTTVEPDLDNEEINHFIKQMRKNYRSDKPNNIPLSNELKLLDVLQHPEYYACAQRSAAYAYRFKCKKEDSNEFDGIAAYYGVSSGRHAWIELVGDDDAAYRVDLGGAPAEVVYHKVIESRVPESLRVKKPRDVIVSTLDAFNLLLQKPGTNTLLVFDTLEQLESAGRYIQLLLRSSIVVKSFNEMQTTQKIVRYMEENDRWDVEEEGGWMLDRLRDVASTHLVIHWPHFSPREQAQSNACMDRPVRRIQHHELPKAMQVISLLVAGPRAYDPSFRSRQDDIVHVVCQFPLPNHAVTDAIPHEIQLYGSHFFKELMLGELVLNRQNRFLKKSELLKSKVIKHLLIHNPPANSRAFDDTVFYLENGLPIIFHHCPMVFGPMQISFKHGYDFRDRTRVVEAIYSNARACDVNGRWIDHVINPSVFQRCLSVNQVSDDRDLITALGWIESHPRSELTIYMTRTLPVQQLCALLDESARCNKKILFMLAPHVELPSEFSVTANWINPNAGAEIEPRVLCLNNVSQDYTQLRTNVGDLIVDVTGRSPDDILYGFKPHFNADTHEFKFSNELSDVLMALMLEKTVYLTGTFSDALLDHLSSLMVNNPYVWINQQKLYLKGKLKLVTAAPLESLAWIHSPVYLSSVAKNPSSLVIDADESGKLAALSSIYWKHAAAFLTGDAGVGKKAFIRYLSQFPAYQIFTENDIDRWASSTHWDAMHAVLVIGSACSRGTDWPQYEGLLQDPPQIFINSRIIQLQPHQKVLFIGTQSEKMPTLFSRIPTMRFKPLTESYIRNNILAPIYETVFQPIMPFDANRSVRDIHADAIAYCSRLYPFHHVPLQISNYILTKSRQPIIKSIVDSLNARQFMMYGLAESARFGGKTALHLKGPAGIGKTVIIQETLSSLGYLRCSNHDLMNKPVNPLAYYVIPASCDPILLLSCLRKAFDQGAIVVVDELDTALSDALVTELCAFLSGLDLNFKGATQPGFTLFSTGNGIGFSGREKLPAQLNVNELEVLDYARSECEQICSTLFSSTLSRDVITREINKHMESPVDYPFRCVMLALQKASNEQTLDNGGVVKRMRLH